MAEQAPEIFKSLEVAQILDRLEWADEFNGYWDRVAAEVGQPVGTPYIVDPLREAMRRLGRSALLETLARPSAHLNALPEPELRAVQPPVMVFPSRTGGLVHQRNGLALDDPGFVGRALADVAIFGAAERLTLAREAAEPA